MLVIKSDNSNAPKKVFEIIIIAKEFDWWKRPFSSLRVFFFVVVLFKAKNSIAILKKKNETKKKSI